MSRTLSPVIGLTILGLLASCTQKPAFDTPSVIIDQPVSSEAHASALSSSLGSSAQSIASSMLASLLITVPFAPQAPFAVWDPLHEEACEEMSLIMVRHFLTQTPLSLDDAESEVQAMVAWEQKNGYGEDVTMRELGAIAASMYGSRVQVLTNVTETMIKNELRKGNPIIVPVAGRTLGNPYFSGEGPWYHVLVLTGFTERGFITNDPGTKRGLSYFYPSDVLLNAIHDWTGVKEEIETGAKTVLVIGL